MHSHGHSVRNQHLSLCNKQEATQSRLRHCQQLTPKLLQDRHYIPYKDLGLTEQSKILGQSRHGLVLQAYYSSMLVAVKPMMPPSTPKIKTLFSPRGPSLTRLSSLDAIVPQFSELSDGHISRDDEQGSPCSKTHLMEHRIAVDEFVGAKRKHTVQQTIKAALGKLQSMSAKIKSCINGSLYRQIKMRQQVGTLLKGCALLRM